MAPLIYNCAPHADPTATSEGRLQTTAPPTATNTPYPTQPPKPTATTAVDPTQSSPQPTESLPTEAPQPSPTAEASVVTIALVKTTDRAYGVRRALELFGLNPGVRQSDQPISCLIASRGR